MGEAASRVALGATCTARGVRFRVWAPRKRRLDLRIEQGDQAGTYRMDCVAEGLFEREVTAAAGDLYRYLVDGQGPFPDPVSRYLPSGVAGPSAVVDPTRYRWSDVSWGGIERSQVIYELHVGTFTTAGTFLGVIERLPYLRDLGVNTIELMPVGEFPGVRNWGYDVANLFAPAHCYGQPDDLRRLVDAAHACGLAMVLDVVYNHFGPDGAYYTAFSSFYCTDRHRTPWGPAINLDGVHSGAVRELLIQNAVYWLKEFHFDGLRLDATHALRDGSKHYFLAELSERVRAALQPRTVLLTAEDERNDARLLRSSTAGGYGLDAVWADDFHHQVRRHVAGDREGYFADYSGTCEDIAATVQSSWFYHGQRLATSNEPRGTESTGLAPERFIVCLQNHDQIGNRAFGDRLHHCIDPAVYRAVSVFLLMLPQTPLLFMGQEWAAHAPFLYFTDHRGPLGARVTAGRRREFAGFTAFADPAVQNSIPDPQSTETFLRSRLDWSELDDPSHAAVHALYRRCLHLRAAFTLLDRGATFQHRCDVIAPGALCLLRWTSTSAMLVLIALDGATDAIDTRWMCSRHLPLSARWSLRLHTEESAFASPGQPPDVDLNRGFPVVAFARPGAAVFGGS